jgi:hypothetical protein
MSNFKADLLNEAITPIATDISYLSKLAERLTAVFSKVIWLYATSTMEDTQGKCFECLEFLKNYQIVSEHYGELHCIHCTIDIHNLWTDVRAENKEIESSGSIYDNLTKQSEPPAFIDDQWYLLSPTSCYFCGYTNDCKHREKRK